jgi:uncharacterized RmlC-like cupin family protein
LPGGTTTVGARLLHPSFGDEPARLTFGALREIAVGLGQSQRAVGARGRRGQRSVTTARSSRLLATASYDVWLITWPPNSGLGPHDHGEARSVIHIVDGELAEEVADQLGSGGGRTRILRTGDSGQMEESVIHQIDNRSVREATSLHVYSPPLARVRRFGPEDPGPHGHQWTAKMSGSLDSPDHAWGEARSSLRADGVTAVKAREAAAMTATARWMYRSALVRTETQGMHKRDDFPALDPTQHHRVLCGGLDEVWTAYEPVRDTETLLRLAESVANRGAA